MIIERTDNELLCINNSELGVKVCRFCVSFIWIIFFRNPHKVASFVIRSLTGRAACTMHECVHLGNLARSLFPRRACTCRIKRNVFIRRKLSRGCGRFPKWGERKRGVKREGGFYREDAVKSFSPIFPFSAPILRSGAFLTSACLARFFLRVYVQNNKRYLLLLKCNQDS